MIIIQESKLKKVLRVIILAFLLLETLMPLKAVRASIKLQQNLAAEKAATLLESLSDSERVGQVFLVTFKGAKFTTDSQIADLIVNRNIGGVVLEAENDNFASPEITTAVLQDLIKKMQAAKRQNQPGSTGPPASDVYIPLLIGISQEGDQYPYDQILNGVTNLPDQMAIGATWNSGNAEMIGEILGKEMSALGINLLFGPSLDVLDTIRSDSGENLGVRTFGGDPFWVGEMGKAFTRGVHEGSENQIAVIATHFPGRGGSDRRPEDEIATVRKSLEQLKQIELAPFFAVTGKAENQDEVVDGLLLSHIRYQGFQGNIRATTKPVSFDSAALDLIMGLPEFSNWKAEGGIIVSDDLGSEAVRKFFDPMNTAFDARQVAKSALLAGNDLLYLGNITSTNDADSYTTVINTLDFFTQKYQEDSAFQKRVDDAVLKILTLKYELYPQFTPGTVSPQASDLNILGASQDQVAQVAQGAVTLISPGNPDLMVLLPEPPQYNDRIVFISDTIAFKQCSSCIDQTIFPAESLMNSILKYYGPGTGDQIQGSRLKAYSFERIRLLLEEGTGIESVQVDLNSADWIVFAFTGINDSRQEIEVFQRLFNEKPELVRDKKLIGMAFNAPYYMDATDISKFTAYYAFYSKIPDFIDTAARILFQELKPSGNLPVSVGGIGYDLITATSPDPTQIIPLYIESPDTSVTPESTPASGYSMPLLYKAGDTIPIRAGVIVDHNGNPVPDGTIVRFQVDSRSANGAVEQIEVQTKDGIARMTYLVPSIGMLELSATADPAQVSQILRLDITDAGGIVTSYQPTPIVSEVPQVTPTIMPTPTQMSYLEQSHQAGKLSLIDWFLSTVVVFAACLFFNYISRRTLSMKWNTRTTLLMGLGGFIAYTLVAAGLFGTESMVQEKGTIYNLLVTIIGLLIGLMGGITWYRFESRRAKTSGKP